MLYSCTVVTTSGRITTPRVATRAKTDAGKVEAIRRELGPDACIGGAKIVAVEWSDASARHVVAV